MKLRDLPQPIRELAEKRIREQGNEPNDSMSITYFQWDATEETYKFWDEIYKGNFTPFYERKQYTLEQLREEKIAVLVENEEQAKVLDIKSWCIESAPYWSISKISRIETDVWSCCDEMFWLNKDFTIINFSQVILPEKLKIYTLDQLREQKVAVLIGTVKEKEILGIPNTIHGLNRYWAISKGGVNDNVWIVGDKDYWESEGFDCIFFAQVVLPIPNATIIPEAKQEVQPPHYKQTAIEPITVIQDWKLSFCLGNVIKYIGRAEHKGNKLADLEKAADYLRMEIESMKR